MHILNPCREQTLLIELLAGGKHNDYWAEPESYNIQRETERIHIDSSGKWLKFLIKLCEHQVELHSFSNSDKKMTKFMWNIVLFSCVTYGLPYMVFFLLIYCVLAI